MKKRTIWSNLGINYEDWKQGWLEWLEDNGMTEEESNLYQWVDETNYLYLDDERCNLNEEVDGVIVCYASLGLWNGKHTGAKTFGTNVKDILYSECDYVDWYCDRYNVRCTASHHDGTNTYLYRVAKDKEIAERLVEKIAYEGMTEQQFMKATKSLRPYVAKAYGYK